VDEYATGGNLFDVYFKVVEVGEGNNNDKDLFSIIRP